MGNSKRFKKKTTPDRSYPNTFDYDGEVVDEKEISFYLVKIDRIKVKKSTVGTIGVLKKMNNRIEFHGPNGRIGNVPTSKIDLILSAGLLSGTITEISKNFDRIRVTLNM